MHSDLKVCEGEWGLHLCRKVWEKERILQYSVTRSSTTIHPSATLLTATPCLQYMPSPLHVSA